MGYVYVRASDCLTWFCEVRGCSVGVARLRLQVGGCNLVFLNDMTGNHLVTDHRRL